MPIRTPRSPGATRSPGAVARAAIALAGLAIAAPALAQVPQSYELHIIEALSTVGMPESWLTDVNGQGEAVGVMTFTEPLPGGGSRTSYKGYRWSAEGGVEVDTRFQSLDAINIHGDVGASGPVARLLDSSGATETVPPLPGDLAFEVGAVTDDRMVVGYSRRQGEISRGIPRDAAYWTAATGTVSVKELAPEAAAVFDANSAGELVGILSNGLFANDRSFYYNLDTGELVNIHTLLRSSFGWEPNRARAINSSGQVVGTTQAFGGSGGSNAYLWSRAGGLEQLAEPDWPTSFPTSEEANDINDHGVIVGGATGFISGEGDRIVAARWLPEGDFQDLNDLVDGGSFTLVRAEAISNSGHIVGWGRWSGSTLPVAFALVPEDGPCPADLDGDGELTFFDFLMFQNLFSAGDLRADFDGDGSLTFFDFLAFQNAFSAGCA